MKRATTPAAGLRSLRSWRPLLLLPALPFLLSFVLSLLLLLPGCIATIPLSKPSSRALWTEERLAPDKWQLTYQGDAETTLEEALDFSMRRAADRCDKHGFPLFIVLHTKAAVHLMDVKKTRYESDRDGEEIEKTRHLTEQLPAATRTVQCLTADGAHDMVFSSTFVSRSITKKYTR